MTSRGVLIRWGLDRLVIVPLHCFNAFHASAVRKRIKQFRSLDKRDPFYRVLADWSTIGTDAVRFEMRTTVGASRKTETGVDLQWYQWGFFDQEGLTVVIVDKKKRILWEEVRQVKIDDRSVKVLFPNHDLFEVPRSAFLDDDWQDLSKWRASVAAILNVVGQDGAPPRH